MPRTLRISHPAISGANAKETIRFYTEALGMELVLREPNLDYEPGAVVSGDTKSRSHEDAKRHEDSRIPS